MKINKIFRWYVLLIKPMSTLFGFVPSVMFHMIWSSLLVAGYAYGYTKGTIGNFSEGILTGLIWSVAIAYSVIFFVFGYSSKLRIKSPLKIVNRMNQMYKGLNLKDDLNIDQLQQLHLDMMKFPKIRLWVGLIEVIFVYIFIIAYDIDNNDLQKVFHYSLAALTAVPLYIFFSFITADLHLSYFRPEVKKRIFQQTGQMPAGFTLSLKIKFVFVLILIVVGAFILLTLMRSDLANTKEGIRYIYSFALYALFLITILAIMFFSTIFSSVDLLRQAANSLRKGKDPQFFPGTSDVELSDLSSGFFNAAQKVLNYQHKLEGEVKNRTIELEQVNENLLEKEKIIQQELEFAADIQKGIVPAQLTPWQGVSFAGVYKPMSKVSGDYYDVFKLPDTMFVVMADVSGHGVPAALITMVAKESFAQAVNKTRTPAEILKIVNKQVCERVHTQDYLTAFLFRIDKDLKVTFSNAAHQHAIHFRYKNKKLESYDTPGLFIGAVPEAGDTYVDKESYLESGDRIFLYTDGIVEHKNPQNEEYGVERLEKMLHETMSLTLANQQKEIMQDLKNFMQEAPIRDDISMLSMELDPQWDKFNENFITANKHYKERRFTKALESYLVCGSIIDTVPQINFLIAKTLIKLRQYEKAITHIEEYLKVRSHDPFGFTLAAHAYLRCGKENIAKAYCEKALQYNPNLKSTKRILSLLNKT